MTPTSRLSTMIIDGVDVPAAAIDAFLLPQIERLRESFVVTGDPHVAYLAGQALVDRVDSLPKAASSFQFARLLTLMADLLLAAGRDRQSMEEGLQLASAAIEILLRTDRTSAETLQALVSAELIVVVIRKALGQFDQALKQLSTARTGLQNRMGATDLDLIMLIRQQVMMHQELSGYCRLAEMAPKYAKSKPIEYYSTVKRIFEYAMNSHRLREAQDVFPEFKRAFRAVSRRLPALSHVSFAKNMGHFMAMEGDRRRAALVLYRIHQEARSRGLLGQERQIQSLLQNIELGGIPGLPTFAVK